MTSFLVYLRKILAAACLTVLASAGSASAQTAPGNPIPFTLISRVMEANPRVVALSIDFGRDLPINWKLERAFSVSAELRPVKTHAGDPIANSAAARAPRTILKAYTSRKPEIGSPAQGRYVIVELDPEDFNASSWYLGFNPGIRQLLPYGENMLYEVRLLHDLNVVAAPMSPSRPGAVAETVKAGAIFQQAGAGIATADRFIQGVFEQPGNAQTRAIAYNLYRPENLSAGARVPLVVFLHGSGQSHDSSQFPKDLSADVRSPLLANQGGVAWVERSREKAFVLVPQAPARDTLDAAGEGGWRSADTQKLLLGLVDRVIADNPSIDGRRLYLTGLSMGALGSWAILTHPDPAVSRKFAAAALFNGLPVAAARLATRPGESPAQKSARLVDDMRMVAYHNVAVPVWLTHADSDPVVPSSGSRAPFAMLTGQGTVDASGGLTVAAGILKASDERAHQYRGTSRAHGAEVRYTEYRFDNGDGFRDLGMVTRHGHFSWEVSFKDQELIDWLFRQGQAPAR